MERRPGAPVEDHKPVTITPFEKEGICHGHLVTSYQDYAKAQSEEGLRIGSILQLETRDIWMLAKVVRCQPDGDGFCADLTLLNSVNKSELSASSGKRDLRWPLLHWTPWSRNPFGLLSKPPRLIGISRRLLCSNISWIAAPGIVGRNPEQRRAIRNSRWSPRAMWLSNHCGSSTTIRSFRFWLWHGKERFRPATGSGSCCSGRIGSARFLLRACSQHGGFVLSFIQVFLAQLFEIYECGLGTSNSPKQFIDLEQRRAFPVLSVIKFTAKDAGARPSLQPKARLRCGFAAALRVPLYQHAGYFRQLIFGQFLNFAQDVSVQLPDLKPLQEVFSGFGIIVDWHGFLLCWCRSPSKVATRPIN
jgi:hypothetical protein